MSVKDKWIRRFSVDETSKHKNGFTIYKITSVLFPLESPEAVTSVSVWKRYSDIQHLHKSMKSLHAGLHLRGVFPALPRYSYFKRFQQEVIEERAKTIKNLLEFVAEHRLLFTSTDFVNFLQTGYPEPERPSGVINTIRSSLHLPIEENPPLEYPTDDDERSPIHTARTTETNSSRDETDFISQIPIYEGTDIEVRKSPPKMTKSISFESITSIDSIDSDLYDELNKLTIKNKPQIRKMLPDLINFDAPSTSRNSTKLGDFSTTSNTELNSSIRTVDFLDTESVSSNFTENLEFRSSSKLSVGSKKSVLSLSNVESKTRTEDSYVFEAGYMLSLAGRCENVGDYQRAFECYKSGIEKMLIGVQTDTDPHRRALIKEKTNKYLSHAEEIYKNHLCDAERSLLPEQDNNGRHCCIPLTMLKRPYEDLALYRVLGILGNKIMLVMHNTDKKCYAMKVIQKIPNNLMEFDDYFLQRTSETKTPVLPTVIPYMVPLQSYIETKNLIFLILSYAPGEKLIDYIKKYAKSIPNTPAREVNLENVFTEPKKHNYDSENNVHNVKIHNDNGTVHNDNGKVHNDNGKVNNDTGTVHNDNGKVHNDNENVEHAYGDNENVDGVAELVLNSQKLLKNVDKVLSEEAIEEVSSELKSEESSTNVVSYVVPSHPRDVIPPSAICKWGAEILTALESLHNMGVICRDLNPTNILLASCGQITLTYVTYYPGQDMSLAKIQENPGTYNMYLNENTNIKHLNSKIKDIPEGYNTYSKIRDIPEGYNKYSKIRDSSESYNTRYKSGVYNMYVAPELYNNVLECERLECDFWSFGAIMYELICGVPLSYYHRNIFTSHTILQLPEGLNLEEESLLTQLLTYDPTERLGGGKDGIEEIKRHPYFKNIDWQEIYNNWIVPD